MAYAQMLIQRYAEDKPKLLNERDHQLVVEMWELSQALFGDKDVDNLEEKTEEGENEGT